MNQRLLGISTRDNKSDSEIAEACLAMIKMPLDRLMRLLRQSSGSLIGM